MNVDLVGTVAGALTTICWLFVLVPPGPVTVNDAL